MKIIYALVSVCACMISFCASARHWCEIKDGSVVCNGDNEHRQCAVPSLKNPRQVATGIYFSCALDDSGVTCWGDKSYGLTDVPRLKNPRQIAVGGNNICALDDDGVKCWGAYSYSFEKLPLLKNPRQVAVGYSHACVLDDDGVKCWGDNYFHQTEIPPLRKVLRISAYEFISCAIDESLVGVKRYVCWGAVPDAGTKILSPSLDQFTNITNGGKYQCGFFKNSLECWGEGVIDPAINNSYGEYIVVADKRKFYRIENETNSELEDLSFVPSMLLSYIFKNELRFFYSFDKTFGEKLFKIFPPGSKYSKLMALFHLELKKEIGLIDTEEKYRFLWNKEIYLPYGHEFLIEPSAPSNDEERKPLLNVLVESIKTTMPLMSDEYKQRASGIILKLVSGMSAATLDEAAEFVSDAGLSPYIRPRVKLQMELIRLLGL